MQFDYKITFKDGVYSAVAVLTGNLPAFIGGRIPASTTFTVAIPASNSQLRIVSHNPTGATWAEGNGFRAPSASPEWDFHPLYYGGGGGRNAYPVLREGDEIVLFSFEIIGAPNFNDKVRPYLNGVDPSSEQYLAAGDAGSNINNSFQLSAANGPIDYYVGNL